MRVRQRQRSQKNVGGKLGNILSLKTRGESVSRRITAVVKAAWNILDTNRSVLPRLKNKNFCVSLVKAVLFEWF